MNDEFALHEKRLVAISIQSDLDRIAEQVVDNSPVDSSAHLVYSTRKTVYVLDVQLKEYESKEAYLEKLLAETRESEKEEGPNYRWESVISPIKGEVIFIEEGGLFIQDHRRGNRVFYREVDSTDLLVGNVVKRGQIIGSRKVGVN